MLEQAQKRPVRGFAAAQVFITVLITNFNLRKIAKFLREERDAEHAANTGEPPRENKQRRRDREQYNPYTKTYPKESFIELQQLGRLSSPLRT